MTLSITTHSIMALRKTKKNVQFSMTLSITINKNNTRIMTLSITTLSITTLCITTRNVQFSITIKN